jgi:GH25 family lysozyme M1 (1,4-beta-N-acetylmuramidase)
MEDTIYVVDLSHYQKPTDFKAAFNFGVRGVIHKVTEGVSYVDPNYAPMRQKCEGSGIFWGAYHYFRPGNIEAQVNHFIKNAKPSPGTLMALDHEERGCSAADAEQFLRLLEAKIGRKGVLYSGHLIKEQLGHQVSEYLGSCRLWVAEWDSSPTHQASWKDLWLHQFTGDGKGPQPHSVPGLGTNIDINRFYGTIEELTETWGGGDASGTPLLVGPYVPTKGNVTAWGQATLNMLGANPPLRMDGSHGSRTMAALKDWQMKHDVMATGLFDQETCQQMLMALEDWNSSR